MQFEEFRELVSRAKPGGEIVFRVKDLEQIRDQFLTMQLEVKEIRDEFQFEMRGLGERLNRIYALVQNRDGVIPPDEDDQPVENLIKKALRERQECSK